MLGDSSRRRHPDPLPRGTDMRQRAAEVADAAEALVDAS